MFVFSRIVDTPLATLSLSLLTVVPLPSNRSVLCSAPVGVDDQIDN